MFERFTDGARQVVVLAQDEARGLGHTWVGTEHLLLGLLRQEDGIAAQALASQGVEIDRVRAEVTSIVGPGPVSDQPPTGQLKFTPRSKKVLELSLREALAHGHNFIDTEHVLLGLVREKDGVASRILVAMGADASTVRDEVERRMPTRISSARGWRARMRGRSPAASAPVRWEYRIERPEPPEWLDAESLNALGDDGWELVTAVPVDLGGGLAFKRRVHLPPAAAAEG
jgi:ATP-dependent Clp protease ATP-binding subunit ClpC